MRSLGQENSTNPSSEQDNSTTHNHRQHMTTYPWLGQGNSAKSFSGQNNHQGHNADMATIQKHRPDETMQKRQLETMQHQ